MSCRDAGLQENAAFAELARAVAHRQRVDAKLAIYDDHWQGYEAALSDLEAALKTYSLALAAVLEARRRHVEAGSA